MSNHPPPQHVSLSPPFSSSSLDYHTFAPHQPHPDAAESISVRPAASASAALKRKADSAAYDEPNDWTSAPEYNSPLQTPASGKVGKATKASRVSKKSGIAGAGLGVVQYGLASTPAMFNSTITEEEIFLCPADGGIMITASHLPYNRNGFKFFTNAGGLGKTDIKSILERAADVYTTFTAESLTSSREKALASVKKVDYMDVYTSDLVKAVRKAAGNLEKPLEGFHIVVDARNGAGGFFAAKVLEPLGAVTSGSQFLEPDGMFPNHIPNPEDKAAMKAITQAVLDNKADLGIIFDTDVDRSAAVDSTGNEFSRNRLIAMMAAIVLEEAASVLGFWL